MVESQIRTNKVTDPVILDAFAEVPRELFVPSAMQGIAYVDEDLNLGGDRYLMEPMVLARLLQIALPEADEVALDVGCATGYSTAVLARLVSTVVGLDSDSGLVATGNDRLSELEIGNAALVNGAMEAGYAKQAPYDIILLSGGVEQVPEALLDQLSPRGRLLGVVRSPEENAPGRAVIMSKIAGTASRRVLFDAAVPRLPGFRLEAGFVF